MYAITGISGKVGGAAARALAAAGQPVRAVPLDKAVPMAATADVGRVAAELLQQTLIGKR